MYVGTDSGINFCLEGRVMVVIHKKLSTLTYIYLPIFFKENLSFFKL